MLVFVGLNTANALRLDLNNPPTPVGGILSFTESALVAIGSFNSWIGSGGDRMLAPKAALTLVLVPFDR